MCIRDRNSHIKDFVLIGNLTKMPQCKEIFPVMEKINAVITGVGGYVPDYILTNEEISRMVDTNDESVSYTHLDVYKRQVSNRIRYPGSPHSKR